MGWLARTTKRTKTRTKTSDEDDGDGDGDGDSDDDDDATSTAIATTPEESTNAPTGPRLAGPRVACGATPDLCSPFGLAAGPKRRAIL